MSPSHGALSKAGKTRDYNKKQFRITGEGLNRKVHKHTRKHDCPRVAKRKRYNKEVLGRQKNERRTW